VAYAVIDEFINIANATSKPMAWTLSNINFIAKVLGVGGLDPYEYFQFGVSDDEKAKIISLIEQRNEAKSHKDYAKADAIRATLQQNGINIMDTQNGVAWERNFE
jgi:cysteinyl-tRNA synthetase